MKPLSIGMFTYSSKPRGSVVHAACLAEALRERGHDVTLYALDKDGEGFFRDVRCQLVLVPAAKASSDVEQLVAQRVAELASFLSARQPRHDLWHAQDCLVASGLLAARERVLTARICRTVHHVERFESVYLELCQERSIRASDLCLSVSSATRADVLRSYGRDTALAPNGVDFARFHAPPRETAQRFRARHGIAADAPLVVSVGGVEERKNTLTMLAAFRRARQVVPNLRWLIAGGASIFEHQSYRSRFAAQLAGLSDAERRSITQLGVLPEEDMPALFQAADVLLHASLHEGFGLCVLEALAAGTRVVVSRGEPFDAYLDDDCSMRVDAQDEADIADGLVRALLPDAAMLARGAQRAREYSWQQSALLHEQHYRDCLRACDRSSSSTPAPRQEV